MSDFKRYKTKKLIFILISTIILSLFCSSCGKRERESPLEQSLEQGTVVFFDTSTSMRGYFGTTNEQTSVIQRFLQTEFRNSISENNLIPLFLSKFGDKITSPQKVQGNIGSLFVFESGSQKKEFFSGENTDLFGVFTKEEFGKYSVSVIITDGIHSGLGGFDIGEMIRAIKTKIDENIYLYLIGIKSEFDYLIFPVITPDAEPFWHKGYRPVYIWLATRNAETGDNLTKDMQLRLKKGSQDVNLEAVCLNSIPSPDVNDIEIESNLPYFGTAPRGKYKEIRVFRTEMDKIDIPLKIKKITSNPDDIEKYWKLSMRLETEVEWADISERNGDWYLSLTYSQLKSSFLKIKVIAVPDTQRFWWGKWSTNNDSNKKDADKTLYLERLGNQIIEPHCSNERELKSLVLKIVKM